MMKKRPITLSFLLSFLILSTYVSAQTTTIVMAQNPIAAFMQKEISSSFFKFIGAPIALPFQTLLIYLLFILIAYIIITDLLNGVNLFEKKGFNYAISLIVVLIGIYSGATYSLIIKITQIQFLSLAATGIVYYLILAILIVYLIIRTFIKILKRKNRTSEERAEERAEKIKLLKRAQDLEARTAEI